MYRQQWRRQGDVAGGARGSGQGEPKPGDWYCGRCGNHNWCAKEVCHRWGCGGTRDANTLQVPLPPNAWRCEGCGLAVYDNPEHRCPRCNTPGHPPGAERIQPEVLERVAREPIRQRRARGYAGAAGGDPELVDFVLRLFAGHTTQRERDDEVDQLLREGQDGLWWVYVDMLARYWMPHSRQRAGMRNLGDMEAHVQTVVGAASDPGGNRYFVLRFEGLEMHARKFRMAQRHGRGRGWRAQAAGGRPRAVEDEPNYFAPAGGLLGRGRNLPLPGPRDIDNAQDQHMRQLQQRIQEEMRQNWLLGQERPAAHGPRGTAQGQGMEGGEHLLPEGALGPPALMDRELQEGHGYGQGDFDYEHDGEAGRDPPQVYRLAAWGDQTSSDSEISL